jgi:cell division control protein 6
MNLSTIFADESKLDPDWIPPSLPHREQHLEKLRSYFDGTLEKGISRHILLTGRIGTGKSVTAKKAYEVLCEEASQLGKNLSWSRVNCMDHPSPQAILSLILDELGIRFSQKGFSVGEMLDCLRKHLLAQDAHLLLILDDVDSHLERFGPRLIYSFTRFGEGVKNKNRVGISLLLTSHKQVFQMLDGQTLSSFGHSSLEFKPYFREELLDIIGQRVELALNLSAISEEICELLADCSASDGDARRAIELLWKAGKLAEEKFQSEITPEDVRIANAEIYSDFSSYKLKYLDPHEKLVLLGLARVLRKQAYAKTSEVEEAYRIQCECYEEKPRMHEQFREYLKRLENQGFIDLKLLSGKGQRGRTHLISLPVPAKALEVKLEKLIG